MEGTECDIKLLENLNKCRCCQRLLIDHQKAVEIDEDIRNQFFCLTQIELLISDKLACRICQLCKLDLQTFSDLRKDLVTKQSDLYELAGLNNNNFINNQEFEYEMIEMLDKEEEFEDGINTDDTTQQTIEDNNEYEETEIIYEDGVNGDILKIEKIELTVNGDDTNYLCSYFDENEKKVETKDVTEFSFQFCKICDLDVLTNYIDEHSELMHVDEECTECSHKFKSKIAMQRHINEVHLVNPKSRKGKKRQLYCGLCVNKYDSKKQLMDHIRSYHQKERNTRCPICDKKFYQRDLKKHIRNVHGEKRIACGVCGKMYTCFENLKLHMRYHSDPQYHCNVENCDRKFHQKSLWEKHMLKHKSERNITCQECNSYFYTLRDLRRHNQRVHEKVVRSCTICNMTFCRKDKYREHIIRFHNDLDDESREKILEQIKNLKWNAPNESITE